MGVEDAVCYFIEGQPSNLPLPRLEGPDGGTIFGLVAVFFFRCTGFRGAYCVASNSEFATEIELTLWRVARIDLAVAGLAHFLLFTFYVGTKEGINSGSLSSFSRGFILLFSWGHFVVYFVARLFLVVEAFISVRHLRAGAYEMVDWAAFIPHL